jgi:hypothetical protein
MTDSKSQIADGSPRKYFAGMRESREAGAPRFLRMLAGLPYLRFAICYLLFSRRDVRAPARIELKPALHAG